MLAANLACEVLEHAINTALAQHRGQGPLFEGASGKVIELKLKELTWPLFVIPRANGVSLLSQYGDTPDVSVSLPLTQAQALSDGNRLMELIKQEQVALIGDLNVLQSFANQLKRLDIDWLAPIAALVGDPAAHKLGGLFAELRHKGSRFQSGASMQLKNWLSDEAKLAPGKAEFSGFRQQVTQLEQATATLEQKIKQLVSR
ncbi:ubiquinone biosynthesis accessory factor UbiJ [Paraferrimonas sedimenticola]|uniref:Ubiquinone biosynthesis accessory factor UbiJ n=1 Tax=Paraferrimonas sedimenticola TaxID=375674 RepID=A0AA37W1I4_9GAMM|nr:SCP2 sterol-binding domain-containing protein [Paraferrimonas sedimenticola]GLP97435.1 DUF1243 domain-containing protein [Paraferrimonas sedimenticola]